MMCSIVLLLEVDSIVPHLEYDLTDKDIHEDLFKIIKYLCEEVFSTKEQVNQVLKLWTTFLEPMLYVPSLLKIFDNVKDVEISTRGATRNEGESDGSPGADSSRLNGGTLPKEDGSRVKKDVKTTSIRDKAPAVGVVNNNVLPRSSTELFGHDATPRLHNVHDCGYEAKSNINDISSCDASRTLPVANGNFAKFEKEEGELSPNFYFDEADLAAYGDHNGSNAKAKHSMEIDADVDDEDSKNVPEEGELSPNFYFDEADLAAYGDHNGSNAKAKHSMEIDADVDDEDSKNVLEGGDDVSGSESTADECSREDHEDGDRDDLDGKAESE
nr:hypothetical protein [Tanacetum cinerariifolium]